MSILFDKIYHTTSFGLVETSDAIFVDGQAYTTQSLSPIHNLAMPVSAPHFFTGAEMVNEDSLLVERNNPQVCLTRTMFLPYGLTQPHSADSTLLFCGKDYGFCGVYYRPTTKTYYQFIKYQDDSSLYKTRLSYFSKNPGEQTSTSWELHRGIGAQDALGSLNMKHPEYAGIDMFLKPMSDDVCFGLHSSTVQNELDNTSNTSNTAMTAFSLADVGTGTETVSVPWLSTGWIQVPYLDTSNTNPWALLVDCPLYTTDTGGKTLFAMNRLTGQSVPLGDFHSTTDGIYGTFVSNAEKVDQASAALGDVAMYSVRMTATELSVVCATVSNFSTTPTATFEDCTFDTAPVFQGIAQKTPSSGTTETRRIRPFLLRVGSPEKTHLGIITYDSKATAVSPNPWFLYLYEVTTKTSLKQVQKISLNKGSTPVCVMPTDSSLNTWLVGYKNFYSLYKWAEASAFYEAYRESWTTPHWLGIDSQGRIWYTEQGSDQRSGRPLFLTITRLNTGYISTFFDRPSYTHMGSAFQTKLTIRITDIGGAYIPKKVTVSITTGDAVFSNDLSEIQITTSEAGDTVLPVTVRQSGTVTVKVQEV